MNIEILQQHELLKTALEATDNYLSVKKAAMEKGMATNTMLHDFSYHMSRAHDALQTLGVLDEHQPYMQVHTEDLLKLHGHKDTTIGDIPYAHVPKADVGEVEESKLVSFFNFVLDEQEDINIDEIVESIEWEDIVDLYDDEEIVEEEYLEERLTAQSRLRKRQTFRRQKPKRTVARNIKLRRASSTQVLKKRAIVAARNAVYRRLLRGRDKASLSAAEKDRIEQQVQRMKYMQNTIVNRMLPKLRSIEQKRLAGYRSKK